MFKHMGYSVKLGQYDGGATGVSTNKLIVLYIKWFIHLTCNFIVK